MEDVPIGGVVAYRDSISPSGVGYDIACRNKAVLLDMPGTSPSAADIPRQSWTKYGPRLTLALDDANAERVDHSLFDSGAWKCQAAAP